jgi:hypothetical protein
MIAVTSYQSQAALEAPQGDALEIFNALSGLSP